MTTIKVKSSSHVEDLVADDWYVCYAEICDDCGRLTVNNSAEVLNNFCDGIEDVCDGHCEQSEVTNIKVWVNPVSFGELPF